jgi:4-hydroxy-4-methyl-2-oxoglutarate aldolase
MNQMSLNGQPLNGLDQLRQFDTCTLANAIERLNIRPRNEGFMRGGAICQFPPLTPTVGHAVTGRIRSYMPPVTGKCYYDRIEWWQYLVTIPPPRVVVLQDVDNLPGFGALFGEVHARICRALGCVAYVTNGAVRDLDGIEPLDFQVFAGSAAVSHAYAHIVDFGEAVEIGGLEIKPGDILHGDRHGVLSVPPELVDKLPAVAGQIQSEEKELFALIESPEFSVEVLGARLQQFTEKQRCT